MISDTVSTATGSADAGSTILLALELSRVSWVEAVRTPSDGRTGRHKLRGGDIGGLLALIERIRAREAERTGRSVQALSCHEAGYDGFWLHRRLEAAGVTNVVIEATSLLVDRRARRAKTDAIDVDALLRALVALARGGTGACRTVQVPTAEAEDAKRAHRERRRLVQERVGHVNRILGLLAARGIYDFRPLRPDRRECLARLVTGDGRPLAPALRREVLREIERLELVLAPVEAERDAAAAADPVIGRLMRLRGIGPEVATVLAREMFYRGFANRRQVAGYAGLTPSPSMSGGTRHEQGIGKAGNAVVRTTMVELAWLWARYQPESRLARWFGERVRGMAGRVRRIAIAALARKLLVALGRYPSAGLVPEGAVLKPVAVAGTT